MVQEQLTDQELREREVQADMGLDFSALARTAPWRRRLLTLLYHPYTELLIFGLILTSIGLLIAEISVVDASHQGLLGLVFGRSQGLFLWADMLITLVFVSEYLLKLLVAPDRVAFFRRNLLDLLALLPILRVFRLGRAVRLFRLLRMLRVVRVGSVLEQRLERVSIESQRFRAENTVIGVYLFFSLAFGTVGITVFEKGVNDNLTSLADGLWWCVVTLTTVGYGDIYPVTPGGKIVATIIMFIGLSFYALLTSTISTVLIQRARSNQGQEMEIATLEHQVVLCGWNETGLTLLQDLLSRPGMPQVVVLTDDQDVIQVSHPRVFYIFADPTTARGLDMARVRHADVVVVLADTTRGRTPQDADARTILTVLAVEQLRPQVHTIAELHHAHNLFHAHNASVDEVLLVGEHTGSMLAQAVRCPGSSAAYRALFRTGSTSDVRERPVLPALHGRTLAAGADALLEAEGVVVLGLRHGAGAPIQLDPDPERLLQPGDILILLAPAAGSAAALRGA